MGWWLRWPGRSVVFVCCLSAAALACAHKRTFGWVEKAYVPDAGVTTKAKMDTGALTSSIYATNVERFRKNGKKWVRFTVNLTDTGSDEVVTTTLERPFVRRIKLSGAGGVDHRLVVTLDICIGEQLLHEQFSLSDRSDKIYGLLIGRRTMEHMGLLDVTRTFTMQPHCKASSVQAGK